MQTNVLAAPQMLVDKQIIRCDEGTLRKLPIQKAVHLLHEQWIMVYEKNQRNDRVYQIADNIYNDLCKASGQLKLRVEEPAWIELERENCREEFEDKLLEYMMGNKDRTIKHPTMVVVVLQKENNYTMFKEVL
jgi:hypothetical protein